MTISNRSAVVINNLGANSWDWPHRRSWFCCGDTWQWRDHDGTGFSLPPRINNGATPSANYMAIPNPRFWINWFANRSQKSERSKAKLIRKLFAPFHPSTDQRWCGIQDCHAVFFNEFENSPLMRRIWCSFIHYLGSAIYQWAVNHV